MAGIHHLGLTVTDVEASCQWYENVLGFRRVGEFSPPGGEPRIRHPARPSSSSEILTTSNSNSSPIHHRRGQGSEVWRSARLRPPDEREDHD
jgi:catechol 2,3-dioxygenase-like lactoylglutathione lyase family enzyme